MDLTKQIEIAVVKADMAIVAICNFLRVAIPVVATIVLLAWIAVRVRHVR